MRVLAPYERALRFVLFFKDVSIEVSYCASFPVSRRGGYSFAEKCTKSTVLAGLSSIRGRQRSSISFRIFVLDVRVVFEASKVIPSSSS
jgi:hypothetical protein